MKKFVLGKKMPKDRKVKPLDIVLTVIFLLVCVFLLHLLLSKVALKHEVSAAEVVTDRVINDIAKNDAGDARALGDSGFQKAHSADELVTLFKTSRQYLHGAPVIDKQTVTNRSTDQAVSVIYKYPSKPQFYIRVIVAKYKGSDKWQLVNISGNSSETPLLKSN